MSKRAIVVADIHGCLDELKDLLDLVKYDPTNDRLISCGDIFDRGPSSVEALRYLKQLNAEVILGNHEDKYIRFNYHQEKSKKTPGYINPMSKFPERKMELYNQLTDEDFTYLRSLPTFVSVTDKIKVIHAGAQANIPFIDQPTGNFVYLRYLKPSGGAFAGTPRGVDGLTFWAEKWPGPECIIYGHFVHNFNSPVIHKTNDKVWCMGIDNGCCFGGKLTAVVFSEEDLKAGTIGTIHQVPARKTYMTFREDGKGISDY